MLKRILDLLRGRSSKTPPAALEPAPHSTHENLSRHAEESRQREANKRHTQPYLTAMAALQQALSATGSTEWE